MKSLQDIVTAVRTKFGVVDQVALNKMEEILTSPLDQVSNLDKHLAKLHQHILMQAAARSIAKFASSGSRLADTTRLPSACLTLTGCTRTLSSTRTRQLLPT